MSFALPLVFLSLFASNAARNDIEFTKDSLKVVQQNVAKNKAVLVDVRSEKEWQDGHIDGSIFLPVTSLRKGGDPKVIAKTLPKRKIVYTFCAVGMRARTAAFALQKHGYTVRALKPGYDDLLKAGFKKVKEKDESAKASTDQKEASTGQRPND
jgi:rhodanese-related sulfurtransferase